MPGDRGPGGRDARSTCSSRQVAKADRAERWPGRREVDRGALLIACAHPGHARERLETLLALARTRECAGTALDELGIVIPGRLLGPDLPGPDILAEAHDRPASDRGRRHARSPVNGRIR